ncbi:hypothetical protein DMY04_13925 [Enterobacter hormaechei subsp. steigerwaltii]|uniref:hypothetical protein n=1 Tax=Enterobacter hormaechei TaxID=158836 RepID=UPI000D75777B|nr:hypothetical protein [Enterobacter hormaechei]PXY63962.1 hypothetical protein DMY04_13925 [Enterobacter hormaechei subsp. steigerwaltii]
MHKLHREIPRHKTDNVKLMAIVNRLQQIMINENLTPDELVGCAGIVRDNHLKYNDISSQKSIVIQPPPRRR